MASLTLSLTDTLIGGRQTIQQVIVSGFPFLFALPPPRKKRKPDRRLYQGTLSAFELMEACSCSERKHIFAIVT